MELVVGVSVINGATPSSLYYVPDNHSKMQIGIFWQLFHTCSEPKSIFHIFCGISQGSYIRAYFLHQTGREGINGARSGQKTAGFISNIY